MAYDLDNFTQDCRGAIETQDGPEARETIRLKLEQLLTNADFVDDAVGDAAEPGVRTLYQDADHDFVVLAHVNKTPHASPPHDHGNSWAVYGQAREYTDMSEYRRLDGTDGDGEAKIELVKSYRLNPGQAGVYDIRAIHSIDYPANARFVRVTGKPLENEPRLKFDMDAEKASFIENRSAS
jgi:hypothetical protein